MSRHVLVVAAVACASLVAPSVHADETAPLVMSNSRTFERAVGAAVVLGRFDDTSLVGVEGWLRWPVGRWSVGARMPLLYATQDTASGASLGNLTLQGTWLASGDHSVGGARAIALDIAVSVPTASGGGDGVVASSTFARFYVQDPGRYAPDTTTLRVHGTIRSQGARYFGQAEIGLHQLIIRDNDDSTLVRLGLGAGYRASPRAMLIAEFTTMTDLIDESRASDDFWHSLDFGLRVRTRSGHLGFRLYVGLDGYLRDAGTAGLMFSYERFL